jgi:polyribonucleotide nucleotidyltransferase
MNIEIGNRILKIERGEFAKRAEEACVVSYGETVVLVTLCKEDTPVEGWSDFIALTCNYLERKYAVGRIPGGFFKREGRPTEKEVLTSRLIDRAIRPLLPKEWNYPLQIVATVLSSDIENDGDILGIVGASGLLSWSSIPFMGPIGAVRIGLIREKFVINPTTTELTSSELNLVVAGDTEGVVMLEGNAREVKEEVIYDAIEVGMKEIERLIEKQREIESKEKRWEKEEINPEIQKKIETKVKEKLSQIVKIRDRKERSKKLKTFKNEIKNNLANEYSEYEIEKILFELTKKEVRKLVREEEVRLDGRGVNDLRPIRCEISILPRAHGSALFTKGETQSLCTITLGTQVDEQKMDELIGEFYKSFMVHYNFPPFSVGEVGSLKAPGRREIGHGVLAEKSLTPVIPNVDSFPYTIRVVADILSSNGSSSMATVCGGSLALMDAGIPIKTHVGGIGIGLIEDKILVDPIGEEDHFGDIDFKLAGTREGVTGMQLDIKRKGLPLDLIKKIIQKGKEAKIEVIEIMEKTISTPKKEISIHAPKLEVIEIPKEKVGAIIGTGGKVIREIIDKTNTKIEISDDGKVIISAESKKNAQEAKKIIQNLVREIEVGKIFLGKVKKILPFGVIIELPGGKEGMIHISQLAHYKVKSPEDILKIGEEVAVKVIDITNGRIQLSRKALIRR